MNPDKLFDYLDGKLSPADRTALEEKLMSDAQLRAQFNIAREIHRSGRDSREVIVPVDAATAERGGRIGRRIATAAIALVFLNVLIGLAVITAKRQKKPVETKEAAIRKQLTESLGAAANKAMPPPTFVASEIQITAPRAEWENVASKIIAGSESFGGSAAKGLPEENFMTVIVDIPAERETEFRQAIASASSISPMPAISAGAQEAAKSSERSIIQVRIAETAR